MLLHFTFINPNCDLLR